MSAPAQERLRVVLHEGPGSRPLEDARRYDVLRTLLERGHGVSSVREDDRSVAPADTADVLVLHERDASGKRSANNEEARAVTPSGDEVAVRFHDVTGVEPGGVADAVDAACQDAGAYTNPGWKPWFPVIDFDRCTNCMQCLSFCLFDVYGVDQVGKIEVRNEEKCKTNCPACSRVCPDVAILFPKYGAGPINGDEVQAEDVDREKMKIDISALLGGDIYSMLRDRHERATSRFSKERDEEKALKERIRCLKKLEEDLDVPPEVLMALPSPDEILRKAQAKRGEVAEGDDD